MPEVATVIFHDIEIGGPDSECAALMAATRHFGTKREVVFGTVYIVTNPKKDGAK